MQMPSRGPAAAALALVGRGLRDRLDRQPLHLEPVAVAGDPGGAGVDHVLDAGHGQRGLGDVGGEHDPPAGVRLRRPGAARRRTAGRTAAGSRCRGRFAAGAARRRCRGSPARRRGTPGCRRALGGQLVDRVADRLDLVAARSSARRPSSPGRRQRPVADLDRVGPAGHLDDRRRVAAASEVLGEPLGVDGRRGDDHLEVGAAGQQLLEVAEDEVDVEAALVRLVDDERVVRRSIRSRCDLGQQDAVGHQLDQRVVADLVGEPDLVADRVAQRRCRAPRRSARRPCGRRSGAAGCARSGRGRRGPAPGRSSASGWSCPSRSRRRRSPPGGRGSPRRCRPCAG